jgi:hypothetical protein
LAKPNVHGQELRMPAAAGIRLSDEKLTPCQAKKC